MAIRGNIIFLYENDIYVKKEDSGFNLTKVRMEKKSDIVRSIEEQCDVNGKVILEFSEEIEFDSRTAIFELEKKPDENYEKLDVSMILKMSKKRRIQYVQGVMELSNIGIRVNLHDEILALENKKCSPLEKDHFRKLHTTLDKNREDKKWDNSFHILSLSIILAVILQHFLIDGDLGISILIYVCLFLGTTVYLYREKVKFKGFKIHFIMLTIVVLASFYIIYSNPVLKLFNLIGIVVSISTMMVMMKSDQGLNPGTFISGMLFILPRVNNLVRNIKEVKGKIHLRKNEDGEKRKERNEKRKAIIQGVLILGLMLVIIVPMLMSADDIFRFKIINISELFYFEVDSFILIRSIIIILITVANISFFMNIRYKAKILKDVTVRNKALRYETCLIVFIGLIAIYLFFSIIQVSYLYGSGNSTLPEGMIYSTYARKGFFELITVAIFNIAVVYASKIMMEDLDIKKLRRVKVMNSLIILFTYNMLFSAAYRMKLYIDAFGYTRLRVFVLWGIGVLGIIMVVIILDIWNKCKNAKSALMVILILMYLGLNIMNVDGIIVRENIKRYNAGEKFDVGYMSYLSWDAIVELKKIHEEGKIDYRSEEDIEAVGEIIEDQSRGTYSKWFEYNVKKSHS